MRKEFNEIFYHGTQTTHHLQASRSVQPDLTDSKRHIIFPIRRSDAIDPSEENLKELTRLLDDKETEEERLLDLYQIVKFDMEKLNARMEKLRREKDAITRNMEALRESNKLDTRLRTINELRLELETDIDSFDFEKKRKVLKILLWGKPGVGVFIKPDYSVEIRGLVDFTRLSNIDKTDRVCGIENTTS